MRCRRRTVALSLTMFTDQLSRRPAEQRLDGAVEGAGTTRYGAVLVSEMRPREKYSRQRALKKPRQN